MHNGGSCQVSLSFDEGKTFTVIKSYIGDCPHASGGNQNFEFTIPSSTPSGQAIFAWYENPNPLPTTSRFNFSFSFFFLKDVVQSDW